MNVLPIQISCHAKSVWCLHCLIVFFAFTSGCSVLRLNSDAGSAIVSPEQEIEILDPGVDPTGNPAVVLNEMDGQMSVDVPPTILVFKYYYSGDRSFQGPLLNGGPYVISAKHPKTNEPVYVPVQLPAGSPQVRYSGKRIELDYGRRGVTVTFGKHAPKIKYRNKPNARFVIKQHRESNASQHLEKTCKDIKGAACDGVAGAAQLIEQVAVPVQNLVQVVPVVNWLPFWDPSYEPGAFARNYFADKNRRNAINESLRNEQTFETIR